jgi:hypothetical protein
MTRALTAIVLSMAVAGCSGAEETAPAAPWVDVGHGLETYAPLDDGDRIEMVLGSQGGWHVDLASHFGGTGPEDHFAIYRIWDLQKSAQISYPIKAFVTPEKVIARADGTYDQVGIRTVFAIAEPAEVRDQEWLVEVELIVAKEVFVDERVVLVIDEVP